MPSRTAAASSPSSLSSSQLVGAERSGLGGRGRRPASPSELARFCPAPPHSPAAPPPTAAPPAILTRRACAHLSPSRWFKLNFDGCVYHDGSGSASIGGPIRGPASVAFAETTDHWSIGVRGGGPRGALIRGLRLVSLSPRLVVEGDDLLLVSSCCVATGAETQTRIPAALHDEIVTLLGCFAEVGVQHVYRESNHRSPMTHTVWTPSSPVAEKADNDRCGVAHDAHALQRQSRRLLGDGPQLRVFEEMHAQTPSSGCAAAGAKNVETEIVAMAKVGAWTRGRIDQLDRHGELKSFASVCISVVVSRCKHVKH
uniref:RNase H type-1 domain-containing protein n=1 Tax=Oryza glumipatula TaxID=40148 RepID=A0A0D9Z601_9ORYZ